MLNKTLTPEFFNKLSEGHFPAVLGIQITEIEEGKMVGEMQVKKEFFAPNGFIHAGSLVTFADSLAGYATVAHLPENAKMFTTLELKTNFMKSAQDGTLECVCVAEHMGKSTQVWCATVTAKDTGKKLAKFSCTQLILY